MAVNIQRARDHGIPDFNTVRLHYGLPPKNFDELIPQNSNIPDVRQEYLIGNMTELYNNDTTKMDLWPAGMLETTNVGPGETFVAIIKDQFERIRDGDRFWWDNNEQQ